MEHGGKYYMFLCVAVGTEKTSTASHATQDILNTGDCFAATALAVSDDLDKWNWKGVVFKPEPGRW